MLMCAACNSYSVSPLTSDDCDDGDDEEEEAAADANAVGKAVE